MCPLFHDWSTQGQSGAGVPGQVRCVNSSTVSLPKVIQSLWYQAREVVQPFLELASLVPGKRWGTKLGKLSPRFHN